jgi:hypothetical protein
MFLSYEESKVGDMENKRGTIRDLQGGKRVVVGM